MSIYSSVKCVSVCVCSAKCASVRRSVCMCVCPTHPFIFRPPHPPPPQINSAARLSWAGPGRAGVEGSLACWWVWLTSQLAALNGGYDRLIRRPPHPESKAAGKTAIQSTRSNWATDGGTIRLLTNCHLNPPSCFGGLEVAFEVHYFQLTWDIQSTFKLLVTTFLLFVFTYIIRCWTQISFSLRHLKKDQFMQFL